MESFGIIGFIFGLAALAQVIMLKKDVETLKEKVQKLGEDSDSETESD